MTPSASVPSNARFTLSFAAITLIAPSSLIVSAAASVAVISSAAGTTRQRKKLIKSVPSRSSVTESLALNGMPEEVKALCRLADISSKSLLLQVVRQDTPEKMTALIEKIASQGGAATRQQLREATARPKAGRPKHYVFAYRPPTKAFNLKLRFAKGRVNREEIIEALEAILHDLRKNR